ncbi:MAG: hypothetical protein MJ061_03420 [Mailhella sp.]|nr:hypothetical protein [Mailhella sp.]
MPSSRCCVGICRPDSGLFDDLPGIGITRSRHVHIPIMQSRIIPGAAPGIPFKECESVVTAFSRRL